MSVTDKTTKLLSQRVNPILAQRIDQIETNTLSYYGGTDYLQKRLTRWAAETDLDWNGGTRAGDGSKITGRLKSSHCIPYPARIVDKITQYVMSIKPIRNTPNFEILQKITENGESIDFVMSEICNQLTYAGWTWVLVDMPTIDSPLAISQGYKIKNRIYPHLINLKANEVVDWNYGINGELNWVIIETSEYIADDPREVAQTVKIRILWEKDGTVTKFYFNVNDSEKIDKVETNKVSLNGIIPLICIGKTKEEPIPFDSIESINRTIMDLESANRTNYYKNCYPQLIAPRSLLDEISEKYSTNSDKAISMVNGQGYPLLISQGDIIPSYLMPDAACIGQMREEIKALKKELFEAVGILIEKETRMVSTADALKIERLDLGSLLKNRAEILEEAENKIVKIMNAWDSDIKIYQPIYNKNFSTADVSDIEKLINVNEKIEDEELKRYVLNKIYSILQQTYGSTDNDDKNVLNSINKINDLNDPVSGD